MEDRDHMGRQTGDTLIPATPSLSEMDGAYVGFIEEIKSEVGKM